MSIIQNDIISSQAGRLDVILTKNLVNLTRNQVKNLIQEQGASVNFEFTKDPSFRVKPGYKIRFSWQIIRQKLDSNLMEQIKVIEENKDYLVIYKPSGMVVHAGANHNGDTLCDWLGKNFEDQLFMQENLDPNSNFEQPHLGGGLVHRIDKETQGLLLVARSFENLNYFQDQFRSRSVLKKYLAVLQGQINKIININGFQARNRRAIMKQFFTLHNVENLDIKKKIELQVPIKGDWRTSHSVFKPLFFSPDHNLTLAEVDIKTGRMHQIRCQAEFLGHPLVFDKLYKNLLEVNLNSLYEQYKEKITFEEKNPEFLNGDIFLEQIEQIFNLNLTQQVMFLKAFYLKFKDKQGNDVEYKV